MIHRLLLLISVLLSTHAFGQHYERNSICGNDTIEVDYISIKTGESVQYKAFECTKVAKLGIRIDIGFNHYQYNAKTENWLGSHSGPLVGLTIAYGNFNFGVKFKPATISPKQNLDFHGEQLTNSAKLNPNKIDFDFGYAVNFKHNISLEPYIALTANSFIVINEEELGKNYHINRTKGFTVGTTLNKYFRLKDFQFLSVFAKYGYGLTNFKKVHPSLGVGYSDIAVGIAYKGFIKQRFLKRI
ncbi:hypothetical protein [Chitinophaga alhagiae]|uniref:hypothetical protein n=1 Tax=Chitinophaga alhagiae TaxID=2203219 RepID=UPI000E5B7B76|nr:hypothetical protein [Chitinophaga alhagiae]